MAMTIDSIKAVRALNSYRLLTEPQFDVYGQLAEILTLDELVRINVVGTAGVDRNDIINEYTVIQRNIVQLAELTKNGTRFVLNSPKDARLIYTCIDHFLISQSKLVTQTTQEITTKMLTDFSELSNLATYMLTFIDIADRMDLMNVVVVDDKPKYNSLFDYAFANKATVNVMEVQQTAAEKEANREYQSPFTAIINRQGCNRTVRFK